MGAAGAYFHAHCLATERRCCRTKTHPAAKLVAATVTAATKPHFKRYKSQPKAHLARSFSSCHEKRKGRP